MCCSPFATWRLLLEGRRLKLWEIKKIFIDPPPSSRAKCSWTLHSDSRKVFVDPPKYWQFCMLLIDTLFCIEVRFVHRSPPFRPRRDLPEPPPPSHTFNLVHPVLLIHVKLLIPMINNKLYFSPPVSDGSGRTGTYCLIDMVLNRMSKGAKEIDIAATLEHIRDQRVNMVKTKVKCPQQRKG